MCGNIASVATINYPALKDDAEEVTRKFREALDLFAKCHNGYNSSKYMDAGEITQLGE